MEYLARTIDGFLQEWKEDKDRKPLLVRGARQVGKSWSIRHLGETFKNFIEVNLEKRRDLLPLFAGTTDVRHLVGQLELLYNTPIVAGETLLFIDEIQFSLEAIGLLRFFKEDYPGLHVVAAGSLLEFALESIPSFGVGRISSLFMFPLSFKEYLSAIGKPSWITAIEKADATAPIFDALHSDLTKAYRDFQIIGGMPACVKAWVESNDYEKCATLQDEIQQSYFDDFGKYAGKMDPELLRATLRSVVAQQGSKFMYSKVGGGYRADAVKEALLRLSQAGLVKAVRMSAANGLPLGSQVNHKFTKYIFLDSGLLLRILNLDFGLDDMRNFIITSSDVDLVNKGTLAEMFVGWEMIKSYNPRMQLDIFYWENISKGTSAEVDYVTACNMLVLPIEVKSGTSGKMKSLRSFMEAKHLNVAVRSSLENFAMLDLANNSKIYIIPLYAIANYKEYLRR